MINYYYDKDLFTSKADALINPVNCKGFMGKGIALQFKEKFPEIFIPYKEACDKEILKPGILLSIDDTKNFDIFPKKQKIILFPTKNHWRGKSKIEWIESGLLFLKNNYKNWDLKSVAMPAIGCGLGGLEWEVVKKKIEEIFNNEDLEIDVYLK